jgi:hypothetical protein
MVNLTTNLRISNHIINFKILWSHELNYSQHAHLSSILNLELFFSRPVGSSGECKWMNLRWGSSPFFLQPPLLPPRSLFSSIFPFLLTPCQLYGAPMRRARVPTAPMLNPPLCPVHACTVFHKKRTVGGATGT